MRSRARLAATMALAGVLLVGCAAVPETSDVRVLRSVPVGPRLVPPAGPMAGASPFRLVRDFIEATGSPANAHAAARAFLTREAAQRWDDGAGLTVIDDFPDTTPQAVGAPDPDRSSVAVRAARIGTLDNRGSFTADASLVGMVLDLVREDGEWRIANPPPGVLVESRAFQQNYRKLNAWFVEPASGTLVPDVRWVPVQPGDTLAGRALDALLGGPSAALAGAVVSALPPGARPRSNVLVDAGGRTVIDLAGMAGVGEQDRRLAAAQLVSTLEGLAQPPLQLLADGEPLVAGKPEWRSADITSVTAASTTRPDLSGLVVYGGSVRELNGIPLAGPAGSGELGVRTAARSSTDGRLAAVTDRSDGLPQLLVGAIGGPLVPVALEATSMTRPTWRPSGAEVWTVINGATVAGVALADTGAPTTYQVNASELAELGPITDLRLSRDGVRVAAVVGGRLVVATVVSGPEEVSIRRPRVLRPAALPPVASVDWARSDQLAVASADPSLRVAEVSVDGLVYRQVSTTNLTAPLTGIVAAPGRDVVVSDATGLWAYSQAQDIWEPMLGGIGPGAVPLYPG